MTNLKATPTHKWRGKHGTVVVWEVEDGTYVSSSSAHHQLAPSSANNPSADMAWLGRLFLGTMHNDDMVSETVLFVSDKEGKFSALDFVERVLSCESHPEVLLQAGFDPMPIPENLPEKENPHNVLNP
jgi:hypothetical protein